MKVTIDIKNVKKDGLPEPSSEKSYFVQHFLGCGYGTYNYKWNYYSDTNTWLKTDETEWKLDFDSVGHENDVTDYFEDPFRDKPEIDCEECTYENPLCGHCIGS